MRDWTLGAEDLGVAADVDVDVDAEVEANGRLEKWRKWEELSTVLVVMAVEKWVNRLGQ